MHVSAPGRYDVSWPLYDVGGPLRGPGYAWVAPQHTEVTGTASGPASAAGQVVACGPDLTDYALQLEAR